MNTLVLIILVILVIGVFGSFPSWSHSQSWGWGPSGLLGAVAIILLVLILMGKL